MGLSYRKSTNVSILWNKPERQVTVRAEITETTLRNLAAILDPTQDGFDDTYPDQSELVGDLGNTPRTGRLPLSLAFRRACRAAQ
jgi:hypothetical protein